MDRSDLKDVASKTPAVTLGFWMIKICAGIMDSFPDATRTT
jgi:uncharacterized membrane-anchored protein